MSMVDETAGAPATRQPPRSLINPFTFSIIAILLGVITGFGAIFFRALIAFVHNLFFLGQLSAAYNANTHTPASPWGPLVILAPVIGGMGVVFLVRHFAPEARGHGVPEVMDAIFYKEGRIRPTVAIVKSLASALAIGSGSAVGREGPIIQIGASLGSSLASLLGLEVWQRITLVAAGAGAGIAATFNTPIGGVLFAVELMLPEVSTRTFLPVALATGTATFIGRIFFGQRPAFEVPAVGTLSPHVSGSYVLILYAVLGLCTGIGAAGFVRTLHATEEWFERLHNPYLRHALGMGAVGIAMYLLFVFSGHYYIQGVGYAAVQDILLGSLRFAPFLALLFLAKLAATSLSLGSGSSGGIFSPSLFMGATLGGFLGSGAHFLFPGLDISVPAFAMVGMAAMVGGGTGAAMTAVTMIFEMTLDYAIVVPMIIAVAVSIGIRRVLSRENIYTIKLQARRHFIPKALHANMFLVRRAGEVMDKDILVLGDDMPFDEFLKLPHEGRLRHVVIVHGDRLTGVLRVNTALRQVPAGVATGVRLGQAASGNFAVARRDDIMFNVINRMWRRKASMTVVVQAGGVPRARTVIGVISKEHIADSVAESVRPYADLE
ncbi:MAG TPA: chloride channel protein [Rhizomicrobium sp.]|nr:chloride channel protein [Rhizomicrobium sp.]